jgi:hypothetical protein
MKRLLGSLALLALLGFALNAVADDKAMKGMDKKDQNVTITGEIVDTGCYLGHAAMGEKHSECATKCIANGNPMGLLTPKGKLYLLTMSHDNADPYNKCKEWASKQVSVTGVVMARNGMTGLQVADAKPASAATSN